LRASRRSALFPGAEGATDTATERVQAKESTRANDEPLIGGAFNIIERTACPDGGSFPL